MQVPQISLPSRSSLLLLAGAGIAVVAGALFMLAGNKDKPMPASGQPERSARHSQEGYPPRFLSDAPASDSTQSKSADAPEGSALTALSANATKSGVGNEARSSASAPPQATSSSGGAASAITSQNSTVTASSSVRPSVNSSDSASGQNFASSSNAASASGGAAGAPIFPGGGSGEPVPTGPINTTGSPLVIPAALAEPNPAFSAPQQVATERLATEFLDAVEGGAGDSSSPAYIQKWRTAQLASDDQYRALNGWQSFIDENVRNAQNQVATGNPTPAP